MQKWLIKALIQRGIGVMPGSHRINRFFQERITGSIRLTRNVFEDHLLRDQTHISTFQSLTGRDLSGHVLEIGTGWHPILPIAFFLCGADRVTTVDIALNLTEAHVRQTVDSFMTAAEDGSLARLLPSVCADRLAAFRTRVEKPWKTFMELLDRLDIHVLVARGAYPTISDASVKMVVSNVALEYLDRAALKTMLGEFARVLADDGVMSHDICMMDQYHAFDPTIPRLNFLRFSDRTWRWINNPLIPLSRLRSPDFVDAFRSAGFDVSIVNATSVSDEELDAVPLAARFQSYDRESLKVLRARYVSHGVSRPAAVPEAAGRISRPERIGLAAGALDLINRGLVNLVDLASIEQLELVGLIV